MFDIVRGQIRGHCVSDLDPLAITTARHANTVEEARSKLLTTYRYHTIYNIGKATYSHAAINQTSPEHL